MEDDFSAILERTSLGVIRKQNVWQKNFYREKCSDLSKKYKPKFIKATKDLTAYVKVQSWMY